MSLPHELPVDLLLKQPRALMVLLDMYEGLAESCDEMQSRERQGPLDPATKAQLRQFQSLYVSRVGVEVSNRKQVKLRAGEIIRSQSSR